MILLFDLIGGKQFLWNICAGSNSQDYDYTMVYASTVVFG